MKLKSCAMYAEILKKETEVSRRLKTPHAH